MPDAFSAFVQLVIDGDVAAASRILKSKPEFATQCFEIGATRAAAMPSFHRDILHYHYQGDTALHMAAAAFQRASARLLVRSGAAVDAKNRRGAEPIHYAADANHWDPKRQSETLAYLISAGANVNARDAGAVTPLHRAVRTRCASAVRALLDGGADLGATNKNGSTPLDLARRNTGAGGSGSPRARQQQAQIIAILLEAGAARGPGAPKRSR